MNVYLSSPAFTKFERQYNEYLNEKLSAIGYKVAHYQQGSLLAETPEFKLVKVRVAVDAANILLMVFDDRMPHELQLLELGLALSDPDSKKLLIGYRQSKTTPNPLPSIRTYFNYVADTELLLIDYLKTYHLRASQTI